jgi:hypothetical protein
MGGRKILYSGGGDLTEDGAKSVYVAVHTKNRFRRPPGFVRCRMVSISICRVATPQEVEGPCVMANGSACARQLRDSYTSAAL